MSSEVKYLHLDAADTVVTVRDRLSRLRGRRVLLVWPDAGKPLQRKLDLILAQREADRRAIQLALVSADPTLKFHAAELNISCFETLEASANGRWKRGRQKVFLPRFHKPGADLQSEDLALIASQMARRKQRKPWRVATERLLVLALLIAVLSAAIYVILPSADVHITLTQEEISVLVDIVADRKADAINLVKGIVPAQVIRQSVETTVTIPTTGYLTLDGASAAGVVTFTNLTESRVLIPSGAILGTSAGEPILFQTVGEALVPAGMGRRVDATVEAMAGYRGDIGNVGPGMINTVLGALAEQVSVINLAAAAGGANRRVKIVAAEDQHNLLASARIQLQSMAFDEMRSALPESQVIIIESIRIAQEQKDWSAYSADIGTMTSELSLTMRALVEALAVDERFGRQVILAKLKAIKPAGYELRPETLAYRRGPFVIGRTSELISFTAAGSATVAANTDRDELRDALAGVSLREAQAYLASRPEISDAVPAQIDIHPPGLQQMPTLPIRVRIHLNEPA